VQSGNILEAVSSYSLLAEAQPSNWWAAYRTAWCYNLLDRHDSAEVYAQAALLLQPGSERCLSELLKALSDDPASVLDYSSLVSGGGSCRYRLARAEIDLDLELNERTSIDWLETSFLNQTDSVAADAGCWLSIIHGSSGLQYIERSVVLMPHIEFYRSLLIDKLIQADNLEDAVFQFEILKETGSGDFYFWQTASSIYEALDDPDGAIEASRRSWELRQTPSSSADLGWKLYFYGRELMRSGQMMNAVPYLRESSSLWSGDSLWAVKSDSLLDLLNEFTSTSAGYGEPI